MKALTTTRTTTSMPRVMMATMNTGLPTIGRIAIRSTPSASSAAAAAATGTATKKPSDLTR